MAEAKGVTDSARQIAPVEPAFGRRVGDLRDAAAVEEACRDIDVVVRVAALHGRARAEAGDAAGFAVNVIGTENVLEGARKAGVRGGVSTSSIWATGHGPAASCRPMRRRAPGEPAAPSQLRRGPARRKLARMLPTNACSA